MTLTAGTQLGHYEITVRLGAGGMGEVWLAEDTRLKRKVALKLLPAELTADAERVRRFEQEAQAASALNHPNILTLHEFGAALTEAWETPARLCLRGRRRTNWFARIWENLRPDPRFKDLLQRMKLPE
jgi:hypothetical protein